MTNETTQYHSNYERNVAMGITTGGIMLNVGVGIGIAAAGYTLAPAIAIGIVGGALIGFGADLTKKLLLGH